jgi:hypothetical protein
MARATESEQTGSTAVNEALGKFARIGFGHAEITRHDNGTDVFLLVRDTRRFDLGLTLGAQIKGGRSWFDEELRDDDGNLIGWWFRDNDGKHIDDWLAHGLPHLIMQHDLDADTSYWAHVTAEAVVPTGKGKKILIPASQRVDENSLDALIAIGATPRAAPAWEGSAWRGARSVLDKDRLRYALLVPRLVAPHPNQGVSSPVTPHQAIAMLMRARLAELHEWTERGLAPTTAAAEASDWYWRFFAALRRRLTTGETDPIVAAHPGAPSDSAHGAAAVAAAACLMEDDRANDAIPILQATLAADRAEQSTTPGSPSSWPALTSRSGV